MKLEDRLENLRTVISGAGDVQQLPERAEALTAAGTWAPTDALPSWAARPANDLLCLSPRTLT